MNTPSTPPPDFFVTAVYKLVTLSKLVYKELMSLCLFRNIHINYTCILENKRLKMLVLFKILKYFCTCSMEVFIIVMQGSLNINKTWVE